MEKQIAKISLGTFVGMTMALVATVRSIPILAAAGWAQITYMVLAVVLFTLPVSLISGELGTALQAEGGPQLWIKTALGDKWGFVASFLLWATVLPGMVMVASTLGPLWGNAFGNIALGNNRWFILANILIFYWLMTALNLRYDMAEVGGNIGVWIGVYIPIVVMLVMGSLAMLKQGLNPNSYLGSFSFNKLFPSLHQLSALKYFAAISFIFTGIEISSVFIPRLHDASKTYTRGIFISLIGIILMNTFNGVLVSNAIPNGEIQLTNITQPVLLWSQILGWPAIIAKVFSFMVGFGVLLKISAWLTAPAKTITEVARNGQLPARLGFHKVNDFGVSKNVILVQSIGVTLFSLIYVVAKDINGVFLTLTNATTILYAIIYILIAAALIKLRKDQPDLPRPYRLGRKGSNVLAYFMAYLLIFGIVLIIVSTLFASDFLQSALVLGISLVLLVLPLIFDHYKKEEWLQQVQQDLKEN